MKVLVSGYYGFDNLGDEALLSGLLGGLERYDVMVLSQKPARTRALHGVRATHRLKGLLPALIATDALISGGGGLLQDRTSRRSLRYYLGVIRLAARLRKRVVVYGQSIGPLSPEGKTAVARALAGVPVSVRDRASQSLLTELGVAAHLAADTALLMPPPRSRPQPEAGPVLIIPRGGFPELTPRLTEVAARLHQDGRTVTAMPLQEAEDGPEVERMQRTAPALERLSAGTPREALEHIAGSSHVISARLHGLILAAVAGRSMSGIVYDPKVEAFLADVGAPAHPLHMDPSRLCHEAMHPSPSDGQRVNALTARARSGLAWLESALA